VPGTFDQETVTALQGLADQVAVALDNARLFSEATAALEAERRAYGEFSREAWMDLLRGRPDWGYRCGPRGTVSTVQSRWRPGMIKAGQSGTTVQSDDLEVSVPVKVQDQVAGIVRLRKPDGSPPWSQGELAMMEALVSQLGLTLESARLHDESQRRAASDRLLAETSARIRETLDLDTVLQTAVREIRQAMGLRDVTIRMGDSNQPGSPLRVEEGRS
jgi:GAF domain-containing protein